MTAMKSILRLRAGKLVRLIVPKEQRPWMRLVYERPEGPGVHVIRLRPCRRVKTRAAQRRECGYPRRWPSYRACRRGYTEFNGAVAIDFENAPMRGLCAELLVQVNGKPSLPKRLFQPARGQCPA